jgi:hypothetical protein
VESVWMNYQQPPRDVASDTERSPRLLEKKARASRLRRNAKK